VLSFLLSGNLAIALDSGLIPDMVALEQCGSASGWMGLMLMLGNFLSGVTGLALGAIGGVLLDTFQRIVRQNGQPKLGYTVLFTLAFVYFLLGTVCLPDQRRQVIAD
jgi:hypothetical protein